MPLQPPATCVSVLPPILLLRRAHVLLIWQLAAEGLRLIGCVRLESAADVNVQQLRVHVSVYEASGNEASGNEASGNEASGSGNGSTREPGCNFS